MHPPVPFVPFIMHFRLLSFLFFLSALHRFRLPVAFPTPRSRLSAPADLPLSPCLVSHTVLPVLLIQLPVCFLSTFPVSLPQPFTRCSLLLPGRLRPFLSASARAARFLSSASGLEPVYSASVSSFPFTAVSLHSRYSAAYLSTASSACFHASSAILVLSFPAILFPAIEVLPHRCYFLRRPFILPFGWILGRSPWLSL